LHPERWQSGRSHRTRNAEYAQVYRGFESLPLRQQILIYQLLSANYAGRSTRSSTNRPARILTVSPHNAKGSRRCGSRQGRVGLLLRRLCRNRRCRKMAQRMVTVRMTRSQSAQRMMGRPMMRGRRRRHLLCDCVTSEAYGKRSRDDEGLDHGSKPSNFVEEPIVACSRSGTRVLRVGFAACPAL
jgi:hypothetical protein